MPIMTKLYRSFFLFFFCSQLSFFFSAAYSANALKNYRDIVRAHYQFVFNQQVEPVKLIIVNDRKFPIPSLGNLIYVKNDLIFPVFKQADFCLMPSEKLTYHFEVCGLCKDCCSHQSAIKETILVEQNLALAQREARFTYTSPFPIKTVINRSKEILELVDLKITLDPDNKIDFEDQQVFEIKMHSKAQKGSVDIFCVAESQYLPVYAGENAKVATYINKSALKRYLLPENHFLQEKLEGVFQKPYMFNSAVTLFQEGFEAKKLLKNEWNIMVFKVPHIKNYLFKKFVNKRASHLQFVNYLRRINGAIVIDNFIKEHKLKHLVVPKKYLYELPSQFFDPYTNQKTYVLIVEDMDIYPGANSLTGENSRQYATMDEEMISELCFLLYGVGGCDAYPQNQPMTHSHQIAFIDTEHCGQYFGDFYRVIKYLNPAVQDFAKALCDELELTTE